MYLRVGGKVRPFNEADVSISYQAVFDGLRRLVKVQTTWQIDGTVLLQTDASQRNMSAALATLEADFRQPTPDLIFLEDNGSTPTPLQLLARNCLSGPSLTNFNYPKDSNKVYAIGTPYTATYVADSLAAGAGRPIIEFSESVTDTGEGGWERVHVGGAINLPEEQIGTQYKPYRYTQSGSAVGLLAYPSVPPPIWPASLKRPRPQVSLMSPEILGAVDQMFRISWAYSYESARPLVGYPHRFTF